MTGLSEHDHEKLVQQLMRHEGARRDAQGRHIPYRCAAGALTIGYGHNLDANPIPGLGASSLLTEAQESLHRSHFIIHFEMTSMAGRVRKIERAFMAAS